MKSVGRVLAIEGDSGSRGEVSRNREIVEGVCGEVAKDPLPAIPEQVDKGR
jgi:hypothetical protein